MNKLLDAESFERALQDLATQITERYLLDQQGNADLLPVLIGIRTCGVHIAKRLQPLLEKSLNQKLDAGILDVGLYRDDVYLPSSVLNTLKSSDLPESIEKRYVILVDDVFYTGRTTRAAIQALLDFGRPNFIRLAVMVDRSCHELPIRPDCIAVNLPGTSSKRIKVQMREEGFLEDAIVTMLWQGTVPFQSNLHHRKCILKCQIL